MGNSMRNLIDLVSLVFLVYLVSLVCLVEIYQSIAFCKPSSNGVLALKSNSFPALEVSSMRRGWPSGLSGPSEITN